MKKLLKTIFRIFDKDDPQRIIILSESDPDDMSG